MGEGRPGMRETGTKPGTVEAERDYFRLVAERLGQKSLTDAQDFSRMIHNLRQTEEQLRKSQEELERKIADRTSQLVQSNRELREITSRYDELVRRIPHGVYTLRVKADGSMQFEYLSPQLCRILGLDAAATLRDARRAFDIAHPEDQEELVRTTRQATRELEPYRWEGRFVVRGEVRWIRIESDPVQTAEGSIVWNGVLSDVTDRKLTEEKLRESEELYRLLTELGPNAITVVDLAGVIRVLNPKALRLFGFADESQAIGAAILDRVAPECRDICRGARRELFSKGSVADLELRLLHSDGTEFSGDVNCSLLRDTQGEPKLIILVAADTTQRKKAQEERLKLQKMEAIGTLAGGLAHDFNNLLQGVFGYITLARLKLNEPEGAQAMLGQAEQAINQAVNLTKQLLTFSKGGQPQKKRVVLARTIENAARFALSGSSSSCTLAIAGDLWSTDADEGQIAQVIQNIVLNASQAMQQAGTVKISADNVELPERSHAALPQGGRFVRIQIADSGVGIPAQHLAKLFDPYFTTKHKGSGLGLATSYSIVKRHEGAIVVSSDSGSGTVFCIYLPANAPQEAARAERKESPAVPVVVSPKGGLVLVMDDEEMVRNVAVKMIEFCGFEAAFAADGVEAIAKLQEAREKGRPFDVVILDLTVKGGMGGEEAIRRIRETDSAIKAVVSTGYSDNPVVSDYRSYGFNAYLNKPYTFTALRDSLTALLADGPTNLEER
jgi:two-component system, cell cycle sensor histidine kinase and response regulator CckA